MESKFYYWGPLLFHTKVNQNDINELKNLCIKDENLNHRKFLAGHIKEEYKINIKKLETILDLYFNDYKNCYINFYGNNIDFYINNAWVNFMKSGEFNPVHFHDNCKLSAVLYLSIPEEIKQENKHFEGKENLKSVEGPGEIVFVISTPTNNFITQKRFFPENGDLFIFPSNLLHYVAPFKSNVERVSISFNMKEKT